MPQGYCKPPLLSAWKALRTRAKGCFTVLGRSRFKKRRLLWCWWRRCGIAAGQPVLQASESCCHTLTLGLRPFLTRLSVFSHLCLPKALLVLCWLDRDKPWANFFPCPLLSLINIKHRNRWRRIYKTETGKAANSEIVKNVWWEKSRVIYLSWHIWMYFWVAKQCF